MQFNNRFQNLAQFMEKAMFNSIMTIHRDKCWMIVISIAKSMKEMNRKLALGSNEQA